MSEATFSYTPPEGGVKPEYADDLRDFVKYRNWEPPKGHASWCAMQLPPPFRKHLQDGGTFRRTSVTWTARCSCAMSPTAKAMRRLSGHKAAPKVKRVEPREVAHCADCERMRREVETYRREIERIADLLAS